MPHDFLFQWSENQSLMIAEYWAKAYLLLDARTGGRHPKAVIISQNRNTTTYVSNQFENNAEDYAIRHFLKTSFRESFLSESLDARKSVEKLHKQLLDTDLRSAPTCVLLDLLRNYAQALKPAELFLLSQAEFTGPVHSIVEKELEKTFGQKTPDMISILLVPASFDLLKREEIDLIRLAIRGASSKLIDEHARRYSLFFYNSYNREKNNEFIRKRVSELKKFGAPELEEKIRRIKSEAEQTWRRQDELLEQIPSETIRENVLLLRDMGWDRLELKQCWAGAEFRFLPLFEEISFRTGIPLEEIFWVYRIEELLAALKGEPKLTPKEIKDRKQDYVIIISDGKARLLSGGKGLKAAQQLVPQHFQQSDVLALKGRPASRGFASGRVRVVLTRGIEQLLKDMDEFRPGEVLVTTMTQPNMVPLAKKACAIVTDEGGITSHAAIIAREFGIPCIVGTHYATKILKTGDLVEVDAVKGTVKKIAESKA